MADWLQQARDDFDRQAWGRAYAQLSAAAADEALEVSDLERLAAAAYLVGHSAESTDVWARAHQECARIGAVARGARCAFWLAFALLNAGDIARGGGWVDRAQRLLDERRLDCVEQGYLRYAAALRAVFTGDPETALTGFSQAGRIGDRFRDAELVTLARIGEGRCLIYLGEPDRGVALLDEAMVAVGAREVSAIAIGDAYCTVIEGVQELFDVRRAHEWTAAMSRWCDEHPELVLYRGQCLVHRGETLLLHGQWAEALAEIQRACARLADQPNPGAYATAAYLRAECHRLRGEHRLADDAYRLANELGRDPQPGLALLRLDQGRIDAAAGAIRRCLDEAGDPISRMPILGPYVEILVAAGDIESAAAAAGELEDVSSASSSPYLRAAAAHMTGLVQLARGDARGALSSLRAARAGWTDLEAPHEAARVRVRLAVARRAVGDIDGAEMERATASAVFTELGAAPALAWLAVTAGAGDATPEGGLTARELEVLALVAKGRSNRQIAAELVISEKTVASHLSHIFAKIDVSSRTEAAAYAYARKLA